MANCVTKHIPNTITCLNLLSGCVGCVMAFEQQYTTALLFIVASAVFDFFDGMAARALHASSPIGKDIDSLADDISFGMAPAVIVFAFMQEKMAACGWPEWGAYAAFLIAAFSALRLAKFNNDTRQTTSFIGLAVPANALFWASLITSQHDRLLGNAWHPACIAVLIVLSCWLLVCELPMFSLKFKNLRWTDNKIQFIFLAGCLLLLPVFGTFGITLVILWYVLLSVVAFVMARNKKNQA